MLQNGAILRSGRNPFEMFLLGACVLSGIVGVLAPAATEGAVARVLPPWAGSVWYAGLFVGAGISFTGVLLRGLKSLLVERVGLLLLAGFFGVYAFAVFALAGWRGVFVSLFVAAFAVAATARFVQIGRDLKKAEAPHAEERRPGGE